MSAGDSEGFRFGLPPSLGPDPVRELAWRLADVLYGAGFSTVIPMRTYEQLEQALLSGEIDAAWGPPVVCAAVEEAGGQVVLRSVRYGSVTYRSVLLCRTRDSFDLQQLGRDTSRVARAVWVDTRSMGGYLLPRHFLRARGVDLGRAFLHEQVLGSYEACFQAVLRGDAEITASFASPRGLGYVALCGDRAFELRALAYTDEAPNDAVVLSPRLASDAAQTLVAGLHRLIAHPTSLALLAASFGVDRFDRPPPRTYAPLLALR